MPYFWTWELQGKFPAILEKPEARSVYDDAQAMLRRIIDENLFQPRGVFGFFPAARIGDDVEIQTSEGTTTLHFLRQQMVKKDDTPNRCLADFIAPKDDYIGAFAVTTGSAVVEVADQFKADHDDYNAILVQAIGDRLAEAFAEKIHKLARDAWGFGASENLSTEEMVKEKYRGIRPAAGYPACPDHTEKTTLFQILEATQNTGIELTESMAMNPPSSVSGLIFSHPQSRYFPLGRIDRDQVADYAQRKGWTIQEVEKWLAPNLGYGA
jgi:5-methyltetrahydrofolate--homocysteine methyltransferase